MCLPSCEGFILMVKAGKQVVSSERRHTAILSATFTHLINPPNENVIRHTPRFVFLSFSAAVKGERESSAFSWDKHSAIIRSSQVIKKTNTF